MFTKETAAFFCSVPYLKRAAYSILNDLSREVTEEGMFKMCKKRGIAFLDLKFFCEHS